MVPTASLVAMLAGVNVCASEKQLAQGVGATENTFAVHGDHNHFELDNNSAAECLYVKNKDSDDSNQDAKILDFLDPMKADSNDRYCHATISVPSKLEIEKLKGEHCKIFSVGPMIFTINYGIPVSLKKRTVLASLFHKLQKNVSTRVCL